MSIAIEQILTATKLLLELKTTTEHDADLRYYINIGATQLFATGTRSLMCKVVDIDCYKAEVDEDFLFFSFADEDSISHTCGGVSPCSCPTFYYFTPPADFAYFKASGYNFGSCANLFTWNNGYLHFPTTVTATKLTYYYLGLSQDCDGYMILQPEYEVALSHFAAYKFVSTANRITKYPPELRKLLWATWLSQYNRLTSEKFAREFKKNKDVIRSMMSKSLTYYKYDKPSGLSPYNGVI